jgi:hypothetical protein
MSGFRLVTAMHSVPVAPCLNFAARNKNSCFSSLFLQNGVHAVHPLRDRQARGGGGARSGLWAGRRKPYVTCLLSPHVCQRGHVQEDMKAHLR